MQFHLVVHGKIGCWLAIEVYVTRSEYNLYIAANDVCMMYVGHVLMYCGY